MTTKIINNNNNETDNEDEIFSKETLSLKDEFVNNDDDINKNNDEDDDDDEDEDNGEGSDDDKGEGNSESKDVKKNVINLNSKGESGESGFLGSSIHYVDACTLWKFPVWLVDRLDCSKLIDNADKMHIQEIRRLVMHQLKATSTDLIMYATVRREFLRTILVIELNNIARIIEACKAAIQITPELKGSFFSSLQLCVGYLENEDKPYNQAFVNLAQTMDQIYLAITPSVYFREFDSYDYNNVYCSYLVPGKVMKFTEMCCGGIIDNTWFSLESKYSAMVMVTPHVFDDPKGIQRGILKSEKYRVEAYFDVNRGRYTGFDKHFKSTINSAYRNNVSLEHLVFNFFSKNEHVVEEKSVFLMNGPETKGNVVFAKIYHCLVTTALL